MPVLAARAPFLKVQTVTAVYFSGAAQPGHFRAVAAWQARRDPELPYVISLNLHPASSSHEFFRCWQSKAGRACEIRSSGNTVLHLICSCDGIQHFRQRGRVLNILLNNNYRADLFYVVTT
jgi:hypothetical protein